MTISSTTTSTSSVSDLQKQLAALQKEIQAEDQSKDDAKTKLEKDQLYQAQITQITAQIAQAQNQSEATTSSSKSVDTYA